MSAEASERAIEPSWTVSGLASLVLHQVIRRPRAILGRVLRSRMLWFAVGMILLCALLTMTQARAQGNGGVAIPKISLGMDTYAHDPLGDFGLTTPVYAECGRRIAQVLKRVVVLQEGGYYLPALGENVRQFLRGLQRIDYRHALLA